MLDGGEGARAVVEIEQERVATVERDGFRIAVRNRDEFERIYGEIFGGKDYDFPTGSAAPYVIDAGAHIGLATLFFKRRHPTARVLALEPNPDTFAVLRRNIDLNGLADVEAVQAAVAPAAGEVPFYASHDSDEHWAWGDTAIPQPWHSADVAKKIDVPAVTLSSLLDRPVDLLKLDIEGMEAAVLAEAAPRLGRVGRVVLEFHGSRANPANSLPRTLATLRRAGFAVEVWQDGRRVGERRIRKDEPYWLMLRAWRAGWFERWWRSLNRWRRPY